MTRLGLTFKQRELLDIIRNAIAKDGTSPSYAQMQSQLNLASRSGVFRLVSALEERGYICRMPNRARSIALVKDASEAIAGSTRPVAIQEPACGTAAITLSPVLSLRIRNLAERRGQSAETFVAAAVELAGGST